MTSVTVEEYRKLLNDYISSEEQIIKRLQYLEALCRNNIKSELEKYKLLCSNAKKNGLNAT